MHPLAASPAHPSDTDCDLLPLWTVDDLHDADLDLYVADRLAESAAVLRDIAASISSRL